MVVDGNVLALIRRMDSDHTLESVHVHVLAALEAAERVERNVKLRATVRRMRASDLCTEPPPSGDALELPSLLPPPPRLSRPNPTAGRYELIRKRTD